MLVDSLVVELGLDPRKFNEGQKKALDEYKKTKSEFVAGGKDIEYSANKSGEAIGGIKTQTLQMFAAFTGGAALLKFATDAVHAGAAAGRLSRNIGVSVETITKFQGLAEQFGGSAEGMAQSFIQMTDALEGWKQGDISPLISEYRALSAAGGVAIDINEGVAKTIQNILANLKNLHDQNPATGGYWQRRVLMDQGLYDAAINSEKTINELLRDTVGLTNHEAEAAGRTERQWNKLLQTVTKGGQRAVLDALASDQQDINMVAGWIDTIFGTHYASKADAVKPSGAGATGAGAFTSQAEKEAFIRQSAVTAGVNPDVAMSVAKSEGFDKFVGDTGTSFGAFQLHVTPGGRGHAVGDEFKRLTGLDPSNKANERETVMFAMEWVKRHGWGDFHGAANGAHIGAWTGVDRGGGNTATTSVVINGGVNVVTKATDAAGIAQDIGGALKKQSYAALANYGQN